MGGYDLKLLSDMSKDYSLRLLDIYGVTELTDGDWDDDSYLQWYGSFFYESNHLEEVILPNIYEINVPMFDSCKNLRRVEVPSNIKKICNGFLSNCPNIEELYIPRDLDVMYDGRFDFNDCFVGSGKRFVSDNKDWPRDLCDDFNDLFAFDGVLYWSTSLYRYPSGEERKEFVIPHGIKEISEGAFCGNPFLRSVIVAKSVNNFMEHPFIRCDNLETIIFKSNCINMYTGRYAPFDGSPLSMYNLPRLKDIFLYAEKPEWVNFNLLRLENIGDVTLHVPCFCKCLYWNFEETGYNAVKKKPYRMFHHIEEFDPVDFIENTE